MAKASFSKKNNSYISTKKLKRMKAAGGRLFQKDTEVDVVPVDPYRKRVFISETMGDNEVQVNRTTNGRLIRVVPVVSFDQSGNKGIMGMSNSK